MPLIWYSFLNFRTYFSGAARQIGILAQVDFTYKTLAYNTVALQAPYKNKRIPDFVERALAQVSFHIGIYAPYRVAVIVFKIDFGQYQLIGGIVSRRKIADFFPVSGFACELVAGYDREFLHILFRKQYIRFAETKRVFPVSILKTQF